MNLDRHESRNDSFEIADNSWLEFHVKYIRCYRHVRRVRASYCYIFILF